MANCGGVAKRWDTWREVAQFQRDMQRFLAPFTHGHGPVKGLKQAPAVNVWRNENGVIVTAEVPGLDPAALEITVNGDQLTIQGMVAQDEWPEGTTYHRRERAVGQFTRTFQLPFRANSSKTEARYERGVLTVVVPQVEEEKPQKITVALS